MTSHRILFPDADKMLATEDRLTKVLSQKRSSRGKSSVAAILPSSQWRSELAKFQFDTAEDLDQLMDWVIASLDDGVVQMTHPGYMGCSILLRRFHLSAQIGLLRLTTHKYVFGLTLPRPSR